MDIHGGNIIWENPQEVLKEAKRHLKRETRSIFGSKLDSWKNFERQGSVSFDLTKALESGVAFVVDTKGGQVKFNPTGRTRAGYQVYRIESPEGLVRTQPIENVSHLFRLVNGPYGRPTDVRIL